MLPHIWIFFLFSNWVFQDDVRFVYFLLYEMPRRHKLWNNKLDLLHTPKSIVYIVNNRTWKQDNIYIVCLSLV